MNLPQFLELAKQNGGGSYNLNTGEVNPTSGFMVSLPESERITQQLDKSSLLTFILENSEKLANPTYFVGLWFDNLQWYIDVSENVPKLRDAAVLGMLYDQLAIFDCERGKTIPLPTMQTAGTITQQKAYVDFVVERIEKERR
jgi:hypothetical protein